MSKGLSDNGLSDSGVFSNGPTENEASKHGERRRTGDGMELPLFPLNVVLFPGMLLPLHIFESRYQEMIGYCLQRKKPFGVVLVEKGGSAIPQRIGTTARIRRVNRHPDGRMDIQTVGIHRFQIEELDYSKSYLTGSVRQLPVVNGATRSANQLAQKLRPKLVEYMELLNHAHSADAELAYIPHDPKPLAFMIAAAMQLKNEEKQKLLELPGVPDILQRERQLLNQEILLLRHMLNTQDAIVGMSGGASGYLFPN